MDLQLFHTNTLIYWYFSSSFALSFVEPSYLLLISFIQ